MKNRDDTYDIENYYDDEYVDEFDDMLNESDYNDDDNIYGGRDSYDDELDELEDIYDDDFLDDDPEEEEEDDEENSHKSKRKVKKTTSKKNIGKYASEKNAKKILSEGSSGTDVRSRFIEIVNDYHSGNPRLQQLASERAIKELEGFIYTIIKRSYHTYSREFFEDLIQEGKIGVMEGLKKYDPQKSMPTTFFYPYIKHEMQNLITKQVDKTTTHYSTIIKKINKVIEEFDEKGQPYTNVDIAIQTGMTIETINQAMNIRMYRDEIHIDGCPPGVLDDKQNSSKIPNPEEIYFEEEERRIIQNAISKNLTEMEIKVLELHFGYNDSEMCSEGEISKKLQIPKDKVKKLLNSAIRKLKNSELKYLFRDHLAKESLLIEEKEISFVNAELAEQDIGFLLDSDNT